MNAQRLTAMGIDYSDGLRRFCGSEKLYEKYLRRLPETTLVNEVHTCVTAGEYLPAFEACHKLKAFVGNLSIPALYDAVCQMTEQLRTGAPDVAQLPRLLEQMEDAYRTASAAIEEEISRE